MDVGGGINTSEVIARLSRDPAFAARWAEEEPKAILAANLARPRHDRGLTQLALATAAGMKQPRIAEIESGEANPKLDTLGRLAAALRVAVGDLFAGAMIPAVSEPWKVVRSSTE